MDNSNKPSQTANRKGRGEKREEEMKVNEINVLDIYRNILELKC